MTRLLPLLIGIAVGCLSSGPLPRAMASDHWAFQPVQRPEIPDGKHPVDHLIGLGLQQQRLTPTPRASLAVLVRRLSYDLHGLPPTDAQLAFAAEKGITALVDQLLASPRYGERWGRHWLDVARYADTKDGVLMYGDNRIRPFAYTYRDYVIRAFNSDKPFDRFIHEQLAADQLELPPGAPELAAMGFLTLGRMFDRNRHDIIDDQIDVVTRGFLGLTVACARCHDHKFDPIPTADYYSLYGVFASSEEPVDRPRIEQPASAAAKSFETAHEAKLAEIRKMLSDQHTLITTTARQRTTRYLLRVATTKPDLNETAIFFLSLLPKQLRPQIVHKWRRYLATHAREGHPVFGPWHDLLSEGQRDPDSLLSDATSLLEKWEKQKVDTRIVRAIRQSAPRNVRELAAIYGSVLQAAAQGGSADRKRDALADVLLGQDSPTWFPLRQTWYLMSRRDKDAYRGLVRALDILAVKQPAAAARAMVLRDTEELYDPVIFRRGDPTLPGNRVPRRFLEVIAGPRPQPFASGSGRLDLARAITDPSNPLTARVLANRIWMHHFGEPLVGTPSDLGLQSDTPAQLDLLDFLANTLVEGGWRQKPLHRLLLTSQAWQRSSVVPEKDTFQDQLKKDPANRYLWRAHRRRLDLESLRDTLLYVSGRLDLKMFGRPEPITSPDNTRRTVYAIVERQSIPDVVRNFDVASPDCSTARRQVTTVPQQALYMLNSPFVASTARSLAERTRGSSPRPEKRVATLYQLALRRMPNDAETRLGVSFAQSRGWSEYAQVLLMTNEFIFVD